MLPFKILQPNLFSLLILLTKSRFSSRVRDFSNICMAFHLSQLFINLSMRDRLGERRNCAGGGKKVRGREKEILGVSQSVSFAYISLVSWNAILSLRQQVESSRQTQASLLGDTEWRGAGRPRITLHNRVMDRPSWCLHPLKVAVRGETECHPPTFTS